MLYKYDKNFILKHKKGYKKQPLKFSEGSRFSKFLLKKKKHFSIMLHDFLGYGVYYSFHKVNLY